METQEALALVGIVDHPGRHQQVLQRERKLRVLVYGYIKLQIEALLFLYVVAAFVKLDPLVRILHVVKDALNAQPILVLSVQVHW